MYCGVETLVDNGVTYYFIDNEEMFSVDSIYGDGMQEGYRFAFFCRAVAEMLRHIDFAPDVLHLNDWQTGLIAAMVRTQYAGDARFGAMRIVFSIHNLRYQGIFDWPLMNARLGFDERLFTPDYLEFYGNLSCMKAGLVFADHINTVSPTYAREIRTAYYGERLDGLLRARGAAVSGILNGIDRTIYDPATDRFLGAHFSVDDMAGKATQKRYLQQEMHLSERAGGAGNRHGLPAHAAEGARPGRARADGYPAHGCAARAAGRRRPALCGSAQLGGVALSRAGGHVHRPQRGAGAPRLCRQRHVPHAVAV